jgi:hypothetical protein
MLTLYETLFLLALNEEKGNLIWFTRKTFAYSIAGLILAELALLGKLGVGEKLRLVVNDEESTHDPILDSALEQICDSDKTHKPAYWVSQLSTDPKKLRQSIGERLVERNILTQEDKRYFRPEATSASEPAPEKYALKQALRAPILSEGELDLRNLALLIMIEAGDLLCLIFTEDEIEAAERAISKQTMSVALGNPVMQVIQEIGQAVSSVREEEMD